MDKQKDGWENDDDWDDWDDAEENFQDAVSVPEEKPKNEKQTVKTTAIPLQQPHHQEPTNNVSVKQKGHSQSPPPPEKCPPSKTHHQEPTTNEKQEDSWGFFRPFGGVVSTITSTVSQGINQVMGVPDPEELARMNLAEASQAKESEDIPTPNKETAPSFGLGLVTTLGSKVLNTGLDTLEGIGKKTMHILQENDPLLINKRKLLGLEQERPNLSAVLKEAKEDADQWENTFKKMQNEKAKSALHFETLFEHHCGLVHLEALEILSKESTLKLQKLYDAVSGQALRELQETVNEVKELMELEDLEGESDGDYTAEELNELLTTSFEDADLQINFDDITNKWSQALIWLEESTERTAEELFSHGVTTLAVTCALEMSKLHKIAELFLVKEHHSTANEVDGIVQLCKQFHIHLNGLTNRFAGRLSTFKDSEEAKALTSTIFSEMLQATQHIERAFHLFLPILQIGAA